MTGWPPELPITPLTNRAFWPYADVPRPVEQPDDVEAPRASSAYVELHCHSCFSLREGASTPLELAMRARSLGYPALALTDHDSLAGAMQFTQAMKAYDVRPIIGAEVTLADDSHLTLLSETPRGYANLSRLLSRANLNSPRGEPRVHFDWLSEHADGLIALSGCRKGEVPRLIEDGDLRGAREAAARYRDVFKSESFFIELQDNLVYEDQSRNEGLVALAHDLELGLVATNNVHYHVRQRHRLHDVLVAVRHRSNLEEARPHLRANSEFYLKPAAEMERLFADLPEALANTIRIAERCTGVVLANEVASTVAASAAHPCRPAPPPPFEEKDWGDTPHAPRQKDYVPLHSLSALLGEAKRVYLEDGSTHPRVKAGACVCECSEETGVEGALPLDREREGCPLAILSPSGEGAEQSSDPPQPHRGDPGGRDSDAQQTRRETDTASKNSEDLQHPGLKAGACASGVHEEAGVQGVQLPDRGEGGCPPMPLYQKKAEQIEKDAQTETSSLGTKRGFDLTRDLSYEFPDYESGDSRTPDELLRDVCYKEALGFYKWPLSKEIEARIDKELTLIRTSRRAGFFLRLWDILRYAHDNNLAVRGRGSSVGSVVCFLLGLSGIDPIKYNLAVERFLSEDRPQTDVPDIDLDFGREARTEMFLHIFDEYTTERAAMVCTFIEYRYASAVRDVGKALGLPEGEIDKIAKRMKSRFAERLENELAAMPEFANRLQFPIWRDFVQLVNELHGLPRHLSQHSGGIIISSNRIDEQVPVERAAMDGRYICQWDKDSVADAGFIKLDLLGYPSLDQLKRGLGYVQERHGKVIRPKDIDLADPEVYEMIQQGDVLGIVQIQSRAQIQVLLRIKVARIEDLIIQVALIRPGPIQGGAVHPYIARCLGQEDVTYDHPDLKDALEETKGVFVFQEQVILAAMAIAGFSSAKAEELRRAMSRKRSREAMEALRQEFFEGALRKGVDAQTAATIYDKILAFASFGFPKSHAAAMAVTAYHIAWLKRYYKAEFYCALLNEQPMGFYSPEVIANDARRHDVEIRGIDVNESCEECTIEEGGPHGAVRLGYHYVKGVGVAAWERLEKERENGPYHSLREFWRRTRLDREAIENLIRIGAFSWTGLHERELLWQLGTFYQPLGAQIPLAISSEESTPALRSFSHKERVITDLTIIGIAVRGSSMDLVRDQLHEGMTPSHRLEELDVGAPVTVAGLVAVRQSPETAKGFVFHTLEDDHGLMNVITKPALINQYRWLIESAPALIVHGHIERQERSINVIAERFEPLPIISDAERRVHNFG